MKWVVFIQFILIIALAIYVFNLNQQVKKQNKNLAILYEHVVRIYQQPEWLLRKVLERDK